MAKGEKPDNEFNNGPSHVVKTKRHNQKQTNIALTPTPTLKKWKNATWIVSPKNYAWTQNENKRDRTLIEKPTYPKPTHKPTNKKMT